MKLNRVSTNKEATVTRKSLGFRSNPIKGIYDRIYVIESKIRYIEMAFATYQKAANEHREKARDNSNGNIWIFITTRAASNWNEYGRDCMIKVSSP